MSKAQQLKEEIIKKAWEDSQFKKQLLDYPKAAVKEAFGVDIPEGVELVVAEETASKYYLVIPQNPAEISDEIEVKFPRW